MFDLNGSIFPTQQKHILCHPQRLPKSQVIYHIIDTSGNCLDVPEVGFCESLAGHPLKSWWYLASRVNQLACPLKRYAFQQGHESSSNHPFFLGRTVGFQGVYIVVVFLIEDTHFLGEFPKQQPWCQGWFHWLNLDLLMKIFLWESKGTWMSRWKLVKVRISGLYRYTPK